MCYTRGDEWMKEWIWWIQCNNDCCCYEWCIIWIDDGHEERVEWDIQYNEIILINDWVILNDDVCWGVHFEGTLLFINMDWILLFSFHLFDKTGWFEELMKEMGKIWKVNQVFLIPLISVFVSNVWWNGYSSHCVSVSNRFTWTRAPPLPHV